MSLLMMAGRAMTSPFTAVTDGPMVGEGKSLLSVVSSGGSSTEQQKLMQCPMVMMGGFLMLLLWWEYNRVFFMIYAGMWTACGCCHLLCRKLWCAKATKTIWQCWY